MMMEANDAPLPHNTDNTVPLLNTPNDDCSRTTIDAENEKQTTETIKKHCALQRAFGLKRRFSECAKAKTMAKMIEIARSLVTEEQFNFIMKEMEKDFPDVESKTKHLMCLANQIDPSLAARCVTILKGKCGLPICRKRKGSHRPVTALSSEAPQTDEADATNPRRESTYSLSSNTESEMPKECNTNDLKTAATDCKPSACIQSMFSRYRSGKPIGSITMAARLGNASMVQSFIKESQGDPKRLQHLRALVDTCGNSALHCAAQGGNTEVIHALVGSGWDVNARTRAGKTPLIVASRKGCPLIVEAFIQEGADVNAADNCGCTALLVALRASHNKVVQALVDAGADLNLSVIHTGMTPLMVAAVAGNATGVEILLRHGASRTLKSRAGFTALLLAAKAGRKEAAIALFRSPSSFSETCNRGFNALHHASQNGHTEVVVRLVQFGFKVDALGGSMKEVVSDPNNLGCCLSVDQGAESETESNSSKRYRHLMVADTTPLMLACEFGRTDTAVVLLNMGADPMKRNSFGLSSVALADINGHTTTVRALRMAGHYTRGRGDSQSSSVSGRRRCAFRVPCSPASSVATTNENSYRSDAGGNAARDSDMGDASNREWMSD